MKKYFMKETGKEVQFGDMIELDFSKDLRNGRVKHHHLECKFLPELVGLLLESGVLEEKEVEGESEQDMIAVIVDTLGALTEALKSLQKDIKEIKYLLKGPVKEG